MIILEVFEDRHEYRDGNPSDVRKKRDLLLAETDYLALSDVTMSDAMRTYRQALRDIPQQPDFPNRFTIPNKPE